MIDAVGGETGCLKLSTAFYARIAGDSELQPLFPGKSLRCATEEFAAFLVQFLGGDEAMTQKRWWLSLRESHARFRITEPQRNAWLAHMGATLRSSQIDREIQDTLFQFFISSSLSILGQQGESMKEPKIAERWKQELALDEFVADIRCGHDDNVLGSFGEFAARPSVFVGVLSRMLQTGRPALVAAIQDAIEQNPTLGTHRYSGKTLLHYAASYGRPEIVSTLLDQGVDPNVPDTGNHPPLYRVANECANDNGPAIVRVLVQAGAQIDRCDGVTRCTPLHMAARRGFVKIAEALLDLGASREARDIKGCTPLDRAIRCRKPEMIRLLSL